MNFIIDANNLVGMMGLLGVKNFDQKLIGIVEHYFARKKINVYLVFDGHDNMGDKVKSGFLSVVYTPKDSYYKSADDKIVELAEDFKIRLKDEITVVTDDRGLIDAVKIKIGDDSKFYFMKASDFAEKLTKNTSPIRLENNQRVNIEADDKDIEEDAKRKINNELSRIWINKKVS